MEKIGEIKIGVLMSRTRYMNKWTRCNKKLAIIAMPILLAFAADPIFFHNREPFFFLDKLAPINIKMQRKSQQLKTI